MKKLNYVFLLSFMLLVIAGCTKSDDFLPDNSPELKSVKVHARGLDQDRFVTMKDYDLTVHYRIIGKGPIDVVFIPGWTNPLTVYTKQFDYFRDKARCIYVDLPGHGLSDAPEGIEYTQALMVDAIQTVVKKEGLKKFIGVGFSWSGTTLKLFEMKHPGMINQLILLDISIPTWPPMNQTIREGQSAYFSSLTWQDKNNMISWTENNPDVPQDYRDWVQYFPEFPSWLMANMLYHCNAIENCQPYPWDIPIIVIYNSMNEVREAKTNLHYPDCEIHLLGGDQHAIQWFDHETVNQKMDDFIADRPGKKY